MSEINKDEKTEAKKVKISKDRRETVTPQKVSFDAYFRMLMTRDISVRPHHKAPMKSWIMSKGNEEATVEEFDILLRKY